MIRKKLIAGNWKMNKTSADAAALAREIVVGLGTSSGADVVICPPFTALEGVAAAIDGSLVKLGAQNMHFEGSGAFTGEVSAPMLRALFATHVILGHSERRSLFGETSEFVNKKVLAALKNQLKPILCVGESLAEREAATTLKVI
ncbi:MAG TPA: triose-phosphate isomerase, partial [Opitutaceae bacterium]|nr:triose-phosphate isomerase [Opitutaceae bacterium]